MQIRNIGDSVRIISHGGRDHTLTPGAWVELSLTGDEAEAYRGLGFELAGEPTKTASATDKKGKSE